MLPYKRDIYGNFVLKSEDLGLNTIQNTLPIFLIDISKTHSGQAVKVDVDYAHAEIIPLLKRLGFDFFYSNDDYAQWVYRNGSPMPERAIVSNLRACIVIIKDEHILFTEQKNNTEWKGKVVLPGGNVNLNELPYDAGIREVREETGLIIGSMDLVAIFCRLSDGLMNTTSTGFFYVCRDFTGTLTMQANEIEQLVWVPIEICASEQTYNGLEIGHYNILCQHILGRAKKTIYSCTELNLHTPGYLQLFWSCLTHVRIQKNLKRGS